MYYNAFVLCETINNQNNGKQLAGTFSLTVSSSMIELVFV